MVKDTLKICVKILEKLEESLDKENVDEKDFSAEALGVSKNRHDNIIEIMFNARLIEGAVINRSSGKINMVFVNNMRITFTGLMFLNDHREKI